MSALYLLVDRRASSDPPSRGRPILALLPRAKRASGEYRFGLGDYPAIPGFPSTPMRHGTFGFAAGRVFFARR